jgi:phage shock protein A
MPLLERVGMLLRSNLNDLMERAEDPEKLCRQLVLDMENQLMQVKTQVAMAIADHHLLTRKHKEHMDEAAGWRGKAALAVEKEKDDLARAALDRSLMNEQAAAGLAQQMEDQTAETELLRSAYSRLERKLMETRSTCEMLIAQNRRARAIGKANEKREVGTVQKRESALARLKDSLAQQQALNTADHLLLDTDSLDDRLGSLEREERVERLLEELKGERRRLGDS